MLLNYIFSIIYLLLEISFKTAMFYALCLYFLIMSPLIKTQYPNERIIYRGDELK